MPWLCHELVGAGYYVFKPKKKKQKTKKKFNYRLKRKKMLSVTD